MEDITFVIKTFERPFCLIRLVKSIYKYYPDAKIVIGDDSAVSCKGTIGKRFPQKDITVYELPYDCGISYGRNFLIGKVNTGYCILLDDDFVFDKKTDVKKCLEVLKEKELDICGGYLRNYPALGVAIDNIKYIPKIILRGVQNYNYIGYIAYKDNEFNIKYYTKRFPDFERVDIVLNFFIAKTEVLRDKCPWDDLLKIHEHTAFFIKAKKLNLNIGFSKEMSVMHKPIRNKKYYQHRFRKQSINWMKLYNIKQLTYSIDDGKEKVQRF